MINLPIIFSVLILLGCAATGEKFVSEKAEKGAARVVVYKLQSYGNAVSFTANGQGCKVQAQGFVDFNAAAGVPFKLRHRSIGDPAPSTLEFTPKAGRTYYVRVETNVASIAAGAVFGALGGLTGGVTGTAIATDEGTFVFREGLETEALTTRYSGGC